MQLVYVYVDEYCTLRQAEFNFSPEVRMSFNAEENAVTVSDSQSNFPKGFWGESIRSLSAVVGNNGAGKTSLMQFIISLFLEAHGDRVINQRGILIFSEGNLLYVYHSIAWKTQLTIDINSKKYQCARLLKQFNRGSLRRYRIMQKGNGCGKIRTWTNK